MAQSGERQKYIVTLDEKEQLLLCCCINVVGESVPHFYIFNGKQIYILKCEIGSCMAMQAKTWMNCFCSQYG